MVKQGSWRHWVSDEMDEPTWLSPVFGVIHPFDIWLTKEMTFHGL